MLFQLNDQIIDIGEPETSLIDAIGVIGLRHDRLKRQDVIELGQDVYFRAGRGREPNFNSRLALASLVVMKLDVDTAMFIVGPDARTRADVQTRFRRAASPLTVVRERLPDMPAWRAALAGIGTQAPNERAA